MDYGINLDQIVLDQFVLHKVGNKSQDEGVRVAKKMMDLDENIGDVVMNYFLGGFKFEELYNFNHEVDLSMNEVFNFCNYIFEDKTQFYKQSINILKHLYDKSNHVKVKGGELYVAYFTDCIVGDEIVDAIGIFKAENKDRYLKLVLDEDKEWTLDCEEGTNAAKLDKGCLVFNTEHEMGYKVATVDLKSAEAKYWRDDFLTVTVLQDEAFQTKSYMDMCKKFAKAGFKEEDKNEKVDFLNRSRDYFENYKEFNEEQFKEVIFEQDYEKVDAFEGYKQDFQEKLGIEDTADETFFIPPSVVKKAKRGFNTSIQLDTQIEIKVHSSKAQADGFLERGYDEERGMKYYKVYFNNEK